MTYAALRSSPKTHRSRPRAALAAARIAWDCFSGNGQREVASMRLLDGLWIAEMLDGTFDTVDADWITAQTPRSLRRLSAALDARAIQGRA